MTLRAVAWDVDGTLVDSEPLHHRALVAATLTFGIDLSDLPEQHFRGIHMGDVWTALRARLPPALQEAEWLYAITSHYIADRGVLKPLPGAVETIAALAIREVPQACVSNSHRAIVETNLDALGISRFMAFTIAFDDVAAGKPDPEPYRIAARRFGLAPAAVLAVEDQRGRPDLGRCRGPTRRLVRSDPDPGAMGGPGDPSRWRLGDPAPLRLILPH